MSHVLVVDGDTVIFDPVFGHRTVSVLPGQIKGTGHATVAGKKVCLAKDISSVEVKNVPYIAGAFVGGQGTLKIQALQPGQPQSWCLSDQPVITTGSQFIAVFEPTSPAKTPNGAQDVSAPTPGKGRFVNQQVFATAG